MITKLTAENAELYYAPRFAEITAAFKAAGKNIEIKSLEDYFDHLVPDIAELTAGAKNMPNAYLLVLPADEEIFTIDANSRAISVPSFVKKNGIGVYGDHHAEMIVMTIDRYFDHEDFLNDKIVINWNFTPAGEKSPSESHAVAAFAPNEELNPGYITFGFIITKDMTPQKGTLTFSVTIYDVDADEIVYSFNTLPATVTINDTLTLLDPHIVKNDTANYVGRLTNSVYIDNTISPIGVPEWKSGDYDKSTKTYTGLTDVAYFDPWEDEHNIYREGALLKAYATLVPATADIVYKWSFKPKDGTVETAREFTTVNKPTDYIRIDLPERDNGAFFYLEDAMGRPNVQEAPLTWDEAKALLDQAIDNEDGLQFLPLQVQKITTIPAGEHQSDYEDNQSRVVFNVASDSNKLYIYSTEELTRFASDDPYQGSGEWVGIDIDTGLESIVGAFLGDVELTEEDEATAAAFGLEAGHIAYWIKADVAAIHSDLLKISAEGFRPTKMIIKYAGIDPEAQGDAAPLRVFDHVNTPVFYVRGSSYRALSAGYYQVQAQARISAGENYEKVLDGAELKVNTDYYVKDANDEIDRLNPIRNEDAYEAQQNGIELYTLISAARNSVPVESQTLYIPEACKPSVSLSVGTEYQFNDTVRKKENYPGPKYVYIDNNIPLEIVATVTIDSTNQEDKAGAFATELVKTSQAMPTYEEIEQRINDGDLTFDRLPSDSKFRFNQTVQQGEYVVRTINRRNGTYSVSDNSESIHTSFVAPAITNIDVNVISEGPDPIPALIGGNRPESGLVNFELNRQHPEYEFELIDHSTNYKDAFCYYYIEEVNYDETTGIATIRTPQDRQDDMFESEEDLRPISATEVIEDEESHLVYKFRIWQDPGYYRIRTENEYNGTVHTAYTDVFGIVTH